MELRVRRVIGFASDPELAGRLHRLAHGGLVESLTPERQDIHRRRLRARTDRGTDCLIALPRDDALGDGAVLALDEQRAVVVRLQVERWLILEPAGEAAALDSATSRATSTGACASRAHDCWSPWRGRRRTTWIASHPCSGTGAPGGSSRRIEDEPRRRAAGPAPAWDSFFPSGAVSFSFGLETLSEDGQVDSPDAVASFLNGQLRARWATCDCQGGRTMTLTPTELERLTIYTAAELARRHRAKGLKLNQPEATALIADEILEGAREGRSVADLIAFGSTILTSDDVMPGVADLMPMIQVEGTFPDGTKLVTVHDPIRPGREPQPEDAVIPGEIIAAEGEIEINAGRRKGRVRVLNTGDRPVQIGSHYHFFEANRALEFDRAAAWGMHLDISAGTAVRFEPGESREVDLAEFGGTGELSGLNDLTGGTIRSDTRRDAALRRARDCGFRGA